ncbi:hypothetical protein RHSIM_Rhsim02G0172000 [Rhododendron simsii]|uniref:Protein FAR1-RELATED SEQUENCE n=1 Tax=Rhododendron simsii TaxID=118357 RepID=A0A834HFC2_RHOSS|nr:hypothetical protein RHSIM_Rhsim02G0172000 [Rhododendron simsii]
MDFVAQQSGGYESVGYTQKDLYNHFTVQRNIEVADGDVEGALAYLCAKAENDLLFYYKYDVDEQNQLNNLFWRDVTCRTDSMCFGDVLIFDLTYGTNAYRKPLVILAGFNSHFQTAIFGCALLTAEIVETYTWVLERFLDSMDHKKPVSIMTDGDKAMRRVIKTMTLAKLRHNEAKVQVESVNSTPVLSTCMKRIEKHAADTYTRGIFNKLLKKIKKEQSLFKVEKVELEDFRVYYLSRYQQPDATGSVNYQPNDGIMKCSCLKFESIGFPCQHMISVMKMEHMREIPSSLILQRWTKTTKSFHLHGSTPMLEWVTQMTRFGALSSTCVEICYYTSHIAKGYNETNKEITKLTSRMRDLYVFHVEEEQRNMRQNDNVEGTSMHFGVGNPIIIKGKGPHNLAKDFIPKTRKCGNCRKSGHIRTKCPKLVHGDNVENINEDEDT